MTAQSATVDTCLPDTFETMPLQSLYEAAWREVLIHKWIESERHGHDLGDSAIHHWWREHWPRYCRRRRVEHILGMHRWSEFDDHDAFGCIYSLILRGDLLADRILDRVDAGYENLDLVNWALEWGLPIDRVIDVLEQIDVNRARLDPGV